MRRLLTSCALIALLLAPAAAAGSSPTAATDDKDGTLSIRNATGLVIIKATATIVGHVDKASRMTVNDPIDTDGPDPLVVGQDTKHKISDTKTVYTGSDIRFKLIGGYFTLYVRGSGITLTAVGQGKVWMDGGPVLHDGTFSIDDGPFRSLPDIYSSFSFGG
jgi:hypothetical protein